MVSPPLRWFDDGKGATCASPDNEENAKTVKNRATLGSSNSTPY